MWLAALIGYIYAAATVGVAADRGLAEAAGRVAVVLGIAFFWWGLRFLTGGRVSYLAAMPGAVAIIVFLSGLRVFSGLVFEPLIVTNAVSYGALGTVLIVPSWLIGVGWVVYGGQLFGRWFHDAWLRAWAQPLGPPGAGRRGGRRAGPRESKHTAWIAGVTCAKARPSPSGRRVLPHVEAGRWPGSGSRGNSRELLPELDGEPLAGAGRLPLSAHQTFGGE